MPQINYISNIELPDGSLYQLKDVGARELIEELQNLGLKFTRAKDAATTPIGVEWYDGETLIVGTLVASDLTKSYIVLVPDNSSGKSIFAEYITLNNGTDESPVYIWELLGTTDISIDDLGDLAYHDAIVINKQRDTVLGENTTFTNADSAVTFTAHQTDQFVKSYPGETMKLQTTSIVGTDGTLSVSQVSATEKTATNTVFGTDVEASKITTEQKTATNTVFGTNTTASKATAGTTVTLAKPASSATNVVNVGSAIEALLASATVTNETLSFVTTTVTHSTVTGINGSENITPYTFTDVTVPVVTSNTDVTVDSVKTNTTVNVPVVTSNDQVKTDKVAITNVNVAKVAATPTILATGKTASSDSNGDDVMVGLGTATKSAALTGLGQGTAAAQTITVGSNDEVDVATFDSLSATAVDINE